MSLLDYKSFLNEQLILEADIPVWKSEMKKRLIDFLPSSNPVDPAKNRGEAIRANFGADSNSAGELIVKFFRTAYSFSDVKIKREFVGKEDVSYTFYDENKKVEKTATAGSDTYVAYEIAADGNTFYVVNTGTTGKTIGKKKLTPIELQVTDVQFLSSDDLASKVIQKIESMGSELVPVAAEYMIDCVKSVLEQTKKPIWSDVNELLADPKNWSSPSISLSKSYASLGSQDVNDITNDFGEILDGLYLLNVVSNLRTAKDTAMQGLIFPGKSNEPLADMTLDGIRVSSKAASGGGKPSIQVIVDEIAAITPAQLQAKEIALTPEEADLMNMFKYVNENLKAGQWLDSVEVYLYFAQQMNAKIAPTVLKRLDYLHNKIGKDLSKNSVISYLDGLSFDEKKSFIEDYWKNTGFNAKNAPKWEKEGKDLIATIYYPLAVDVVNALNNGYSNSLTSLVRKFIEYKQVYLSINAKKDPDSLSFSGISSRYVPEVKFYARASSNTWNAGLGFELKK